MKIGKALNEATNEILSFLNIFVQSFYFNKILIIITNQIKFKKLEKF